MQPNRNIIFFYFTHSSKLHYPQCNSSSGSCVWDWSVLCCSRDAVSSHHLRTCIRPKRLTVLSWGLFSCLWAQCFICERCYFLFLKQKHYADWADSKSYSPQNAVKALWDFVVSWCSDFSVQHHIRLWFYYNPYSTDDKQKHKQETISIPHAGSSPLFLQLFQHNKPQTSGSLLHSVNVNNSRTYSLFPFPQRHTMGSAGESQAADS